MSRQAGAVRIEAGSLRGRVLAVPPGARPTVGRVRGALFSIWSAEVPGARFLDLFAGSGVVGLEAISRGALEAVFVEGSRRAQVVLERNLRLAPAGSAELVGGRLPGVLSRLGGRPSPFDLVFLDPPYDQPPAPALLEALEALAAPGARLAAEHAVRA
ncbi:MAG TPA: RsmD family RNA methyltransferase, partial [Thermoanaerobaculia bacterium]|nr:RsmD family RNA methyltransferase [Thermoanaerobaculia bacterium]